MTMVRLLTILRDEMRTKFDFGFGLGIELFFGSGSWTKSNLGPADNRIWVLGPNHMNQSVSITGANVYTYTGLNF